MKGDARVLADDFLGPSSFFGIRELIQKSNKYAADSFN